MQEEVLKIIATRDQLPNLTTEVFLSGKPGILGVLGMQKIAESHAAEVKAKQTAQGEATRFKDAVQNIVRILDDKADGAEVTKDRLEAVMAHWAQQVALEPEKRDKNTGDDTIQSQG